MTRRARIPALLTGDTVGMVLAPLLRARLGVTDRLQGDLAIHRDQLAEVDRERAAGSLSAQDAAAARTEIERRLLAAADKGTTTTPPPATAWRRFLPPALCLLVSAFALGLYLRTGQPGMPSATVVPHPYAPITALPATGHTLVQQIATARARLKEKPDDPGTLSALGELLARQADSEQAVSDVGHDAANRPRLSRRFEDGDCHFAKGRVDADHMHAVLTSHAAPR